MLGADNCPPYCSCYSYQLKSSVDRADGPMAHHGLQNSIDLWPRGIVINPRIRKFDSADKPTNKKTVNV